MEVLTPASRQAVLTYTGALSGGRSLVVVASFPVATRGGYPAFHALLRHRKVNGELDPEDEAERVQTFQ
jgi:hypothetical protein